MVEQRVTVSQQGALVAQVVADRGRVAEALRSARLVSARGRREEPEEDGGAAPGGRLSFVLFLESFAPLVNSLNLGIASPLVLGPPPFQLAHIKTQLALQQLTTSSSAPPHAYFGRAVLKSTMFSPRGALPQRPRGPNPSAAKPPGSFQGGTGPQRPPAPGAPRGAAPRASGQDSVPWTGSQRINVRVTLHRADPRQAKAKGSLHQEQKGDVRVGRWDGSPCPPPPVVSQKPPARLPEQSAAAQNRYTPESASSILASFGLSNEDLEELSRYPDDQLTPENMPLILREIRMRKMGHPLPGLHSQSRGEVMSGTSGVAIKGKVIDYGHASKYGYTEDPLEVRGYNMEMLREEPLDARPYNPEVPSGEKREEFHREQSMPMGVPPAGMACGPAFPPQDVMKPPPAFQSDPANPHPFFPAEPAGKAGGLCAAPVGKAGPPPAVLPVMPPILPLAVPPMAQPVVPPLISQPVVPVIPQPPFSAELLAILEQRDRIQHEAGSSQPSAQSSGMGQKPFQTQPEGPIKSPFGVVKASWLPSFLQSDSQKIKRLPTPSMMNDYYATSPRIFPHMCSLCNVECARMKDWILHQNTPSHIESCRHLRQQYPDWNPESRSSKRNAADRKENQTPKHRCNSASPGPRRPRPAGCSHAPRHSRSRSRSPGRYRPARPRSRSPRSARRLSPRHWSRSPQRSRNPLRGSPRPQRSSSNDWSSRRSSRSQDRKAALEAVMKTLGPGFVAEFNKHKSSQASTPGASGSGKSAPSHGAAGKVPGNGKKTPKTSVAVKAVKKEAVPLPASGSSPQSDELPQEKEVEEEEEDPPAGPSRPRAAPYNRLLREELLNCGTVLQISNLPDDGFSDQDIKKIVQPFGKVSDLIVLRSRNKAYLEMNYKEAVIAAVKYGETVPVLVNGKQVKISVAEKPKASPSQAKTSVKKKTRTIKKVAPSTRKHPTTSTTSSKTTKTIAGKKEKTKKPVGTKESKAKTTSDTADQSEENESKDLQSSPESEMEIEEGELVEPGSPAEGDDGVTEPTKAGEAQSEAVGNPAPLPEKAAQVLQEVPLGSDGQKEALIDGEASAVTVKSEEAAELGSKEADDVCVVLVSNLPEKGYSVEEVSNLAKPFGGLRDVLIVSSHKKAYLEINRKSAESMVKFYTCFPMTLDGNQLCITLAPQHRSVKDEEAIFTAIIKDSDPKVNAEVVQQQFVHLGNLPEEGYREFEVVCVGLRFGKVDHYVVLKNRNKAILQLESPKAARSMFCFLNQYSYTMGEHTLTCSLSPGRQQADPEAVKKEVKKEEPSRGSSSLKKYTEGSGVVQTAAAHPAVEPSVVKKEPISTPPVEDELPVVKTEPSESHLEGAQRDSAAALAEQTSRKAGAELIDEPLGSAGAELPTAKPEEKLLPPPSTGKEEAITDGAASKLPVPAVGSAAQQGRVLGAEGPGAAGELLGAADPVPADMGSSVVPHRNPKADAAKKTRVNDLVKTEREKQRAPAAEVKPELEAGAAPGRTLAGDGTGVDVEVRAEGAVLHGGTAGEESPQLKSAAEVEKKREQCVAEVGAAVENSSKNVKEKKGSLSKAPQSKEARPAKMKEAVKAAASNSSSSTREPSSAPKEILKAEASVPDTLKPSDAVQRRKPALCKGEEQAASSKARSQGAAAGQKKALKEEGQPRASTSQPSGSAKGGSGRNASLQDKDSRVEPRAGSKQPQEGESRSSSAKKDSSSTKVSTGGNTRTSKSSGSSSTKQKEEEELFPFNLDEFVTVDEVIEESEPPVKTQHSQPKGKRKECSRSTSEPSSKRRKERSSPQRLAESQLSFVMLDEIGEEEEEAGAQLGMLVVDEVVEEEELLAEVGEEPRVLLTLDELQEQGGSRRDGCASEGRRLKPEPLVTVDEIGEVEELPLNEPTELSGEEKQKEEEKGGAEDPCQVPDDPSALVTVDEIREDHEDDGAAWDEANEDEDDFLADFNRLKEELNFVTVDEVGEEDEEEESALPGENPKEGEDKEENAAAVGPEEEMAAAAGPEEEDIVAVAGPEEMEVLGSAHPEEEESAASKSKDLDYLLPKAGFFCQICSLFYSDETSVKNHCRTALHQQNAERFMATQEEESSGAEHSPR
ncbi:zinc finger protein 638 [Phasianus colchicus]|uniref:zinc finger protein 638 n=1 Tax=Phasianus colchicus TaxID=9054 RepID=UPI00129D6A09|nr:zinc finger protein 638 [Phasianus colchicus]